MHQFNWFGADFSEGFEERQAIETQNRLHAQLNAKVPMLTDDALTNELAHEPDEIKAAFNVIDALTALKIRTIAEGFKTSAGVAWIRRPTGL